MFRSGGGRFGIGSWRKGRRHDFLPRQRRTDRPTATEITRTNMRLSFINQRCPKTGRMLPANPDEQFWSRVTKTNGCWLWTGGKCRGYGMIKYKGKHTKSHVVSWLIHFGNIAQGKCVLHRCDNPSCVRPDHLFLGTNQENQADKVSKHRQARGSRHGNASLSELDVIAIRRRSGTETRRRLASEYDTSVNAINKIISRQTWRHL